MGFGVLAELHGLGFAFDIGSLAFVLWVALLAWEGRRRQTVRKLRWRRCTLDGRSHCWVSVPLSCVPGLHAEIQSQCGDVSKVPLLSCCRQEG